MKIILPLSAPRLSSHAGFEYYTVRLSAEMHGERYEWLTVHGDNALSNAEHIVRCLNEHDALALRVTVLENALKHIRDTAHKPGSSIAGVINVCEQVVGREIES